MSPTAVSLPPRYRVERHIANGGMASVWEAQDEVLQRPVAVKLVAEHLTADPAARRRFEREARAAAGLSQHPHVVTIYDFGEYEGRAFLVMELMRGGSIGDLLRDGVRLRRDNVLRWIDEAASALDAAHDAGIVHRDVKPANMLLDQRGRLGLADFGIARLAAEDQFTQTGQILGTAAYVSPEQALGERVGAPSDRYSLAVVAFELLTRTKPFQAEHYAAQARMHIDDPPPRASERDPELGPAVDAVLIRALAKRPEDRFPTTGAFAAELRRAVERPAATPTRAAVAPAPAPPPTVATRRFDEPPAPRAPTATSTEPPLTPPPRQRRRRVLPAVLLAALLGLAALIAIIVVAGSGGGGGDSTARDRTPQRTPQASATPRATATATPTATATAQSTATATATATPTATATATATAAPSGGSGGSRSASALNAEGFASIQRGDPGGAVAPLRRAYTACRGSTAVDPCAYALYNLGHALRVSGSPAEAVPILQERLQRFPNDQGATVRRELALAKAGNTASGGSSSAGNSGKGKKGKG